MLLRTLVLAFAFVSTGAMAATLDDMPLAAGHVPPDYAAFDEVNPSLGQPFAAKVDGVPKRQYYPGAPVYFVYKGKVIGIGIDLNENDVINRGMSYDNIKLPEWLPKIDHVDIVHNHEGGWGGLGPAVTMSLWFVGADVLHDIQF